MNHRKANMQKSKSRVRRKVAVMGDPKIGKSAIIRALQGKPSQSQYTATEETGISCLKLPVQGQTHHIVLVEVPIAASAEALDAALFGCEIIFLVCSDPKSLQGIHSLVVLLKKYNTQAQLVLVSNSYSQPNLNPTSTEYNLRNMAASYNMRLIKVEPPLGKAGMRYMLELLQEYVDLRHIKKKKVEVDYKFSLEKQRKKKLLQEGKRLLSAIRRNIQQRNVQKCEQLPIENVISIKNKKNVIPRKQVNRESHRRILGQLDLNAIECSSISPKAQLLSINVFPAGSDIEQINDERHNFTFYEEAEASTSPQEEVEELGIHSFKEKTQRSSIQTQSAERAVNKPAVNIADKLTRSNTKAHAKTGQSLAVIRVATLIILLTFLAIVKTLGF